MLRIDARESQYSIAREGAKKKAKTKKWQHLERHTAQEPLNMVEAGCGLAVLHQNNNC
jgi:hypothetical protein